MAQDHGAYMGLVVNTDDELLDMPSGREVTSNVDIPFGIARSIDGQLNFFLLATTFTYCMSNLLTANDLYAA